MCHSIRKLSVGRRFNPSKQAQRSIARCSRAVGLKVLLCALALAATTVGVSRAAVITYRFAAEVEEVDPRLEGQGLPGVGETLEGSFSWDSELKPSGFVFIPPGSVGGEYRGDFRDVPFVEWGPTRNLVPTAGYDLSIFDNLPSSGDTFQFSTSYRSVCDSVCLAQRGEFTLSLGDEDGSAFLSANLPTRLDLPDFEQATVSLTDIFYGDLRANITKLVEVPEPSSWLLGLLGLPLVVASPFSTRRCHRRIQPWLPLWHGFSAAACRDI